VSVRDGYGNSMDAPVCPTCGKIMTDAYELFPRGDNIVETECGWCDAAMSVEQRTSIAYITRAVAPQEGKQAPEKMGLSGNLIVIGEGGEPR
jgi:hypothetical protein